MPEPIIPERSRQRIAADNRDEIATWLEERAAALVAGGLAPAEAARKAAEEFGDVAGAERYSRRQDIAADRRIRVLFWLEDLGADLRIALRTLGRTPTVTAVVLLTFALGVGATTSVFSVVHALLLRPLAYGDEGSLVYFQATDRGSIGPNPRFSEATVSGLRERTSSFAGIAAVSAGNYIVSDGGDPEQIMGATVTGNTFDLLQVRAALGRVFGPAEESEPSGPVVVLGDDLWRRRFGADPGIVGRVVHLSGPKLVIGVMPRSVRVPTYEDAQFWAPHDAAGFDRNPQTRHVRVMRSVGRLKPGVPLDVAQADVDRVMRSLATELPRENGGVGTRLVPIRTAVSGNAAPRLLVLMGAAGFVLLLACTNVAGILLSRALARWHELSIRVALGAGRRRLIRQFLAEGMVLALLGTGLSLAVAQMGIVGLRHAAGAALPTGTVFGLEPGVLWFGIGAAIAGALASSLVPALGATRVPGVALRRDGGRSSTPVNRALRLALVAGQLAVAVVLLVGAGLFLRTLHALTRLDPGYATEHVLTFRPFFTTPKSDAEQDVFYASLYEQLRAIPGVAAVGGGNMPMMGQHSVARLEIEGRPANDGLLPDARYSVASDDYFSTLGIPVLRGRVFGPADRADAPWVAVVSERLANQVWPNGDAIGARVKPERKPWVTIVGIVGDVQKGSAEEAVPSMYSSQRQDHWPGGGTVVMRAEGDPRSLMASVREVMKRLDPMMPLIGLRTVEEIRQSSPAVASTKLQMRLVLAFAVVALMVSAIGVYGVGAYTTEARRREFGIRMALGASRRGVMWLALRDAASVALVAALVGMPLALLLASGMRDLLYSVAPFDPVTVGAALGALFAVVLAASAIPARRATLIDPAGTMRTD